MCETAKKLYENTNWPYVFIKSTLNNEKQATRHRQLRFYNFAFSEIKYINLEYKEYKILKEEKKWNKEKRTERKKKWKKKRKKR